MAREVESLNSELLGLSLSMEYDVIIASGSSGKVLVRQGNVPELDNTAQESLKCNSRPMVPGMVCSEIWKWDDSLFLGAIAPVYKSRLVVDYEQDLSERNFLGTIIIATALNNSFAEKIRERTGVEVIIRSGDVVYATSLKELRGTEVEFEWETTSGYSEFSSSEIAGISYLTASLPLSAETGENLGEIIILADNNILVETMQQIYSTIFTVSALILILGMALSAAFARGIGLSIYSLAESAEMIGKGDFTRRIQMKSHIELDILAQSFNNMSSNLESLIAEKENYLKKISLQHIKILEQKEYMTWLFENANDLIFVMDLGGNVTFINKQINEYGFTIDEVLGKQANSIIAFDRDNGGDWKDFGNPGVREVALMPKKGTMRWMLFSSSTIKDQSGSITNVLCILRDITEQKKIEENMFHVERLACTGRLAAGLAHEIGNPLTSISSFLQFLKKNETGAFAEDCISTIQRHIQRIYFTVERLKNLSRPHSLEKYSKVDFPKVLNSTIEIVRFDPRLREIEIVQQMDDGLPPISIQVDQVIQVLINLIFNAADSMNNIGTITINMGVNKGNDYIDIEVIDTGTGIAEEHMECLFDPFFTTKGNNKGSGLGLYVSQSIIQQQGGEIKVKSAGPEGTTFLIRIPASEKILITTE
jgi:PAS domain S-box-containing protein